MFTPFAFIKQEVAGGGGSVVTSNLVAYFDAGNASSYTSGSSTWNNIASGYTDYDLTGYNVNYTSSLGGFFKFTGTEYFENTDFPAMNRANSSGSNELSVVAVVQSNDTSTGYQGWVGNANGDFTNINWRLAQLTTPQNGNFGFMGTNQNPFVFTNPASTWKIYTITSEGGLGTTRLYQNTSQLDSFTMSGAGYGSQVSKLRVGVFNAANSNPFIGNMGAILVYQKVLTTDEITQNYNFFQSRFGL
jgi:hypothetical protein